jgi:hypothetical protein
VKLKAMEFAKPGSRDARTLMTPGSHAAPGGFFLRRGRMQTGDDVRLFLIAVFGAVGSSKASGR